ncbi:CRISPR-associated endonuclease/helicase Cas3 [Sporomusa ovata DSM 2662]|uniref:CRISPR-associated helicase Cas3 n=2 Tax=Sporomusa ovata TaxID=2378 RepID=A0A0U1KTM1_9FIRM|nr:CRISPR-associated nuclease/helicase Cas3 [Sporomusa ovata DSM 2662]CQR70766.1 CRISPR-associated helicase Cas3 [Sporomusa ovata]
MLTPLTDCPFFSGAFTSLFRHIADVVTAAEHLKSDRDPAEWWHALIMAALLHDIGKLDPNFQQAVANRQHAAGDENELSHNVLALFLLDEQLFSKQVKEPESVLSAIVFHHWRDYYVDLIMGNRIDDIKSKAEEILSRAGEWMDWLQDLREQLQDIAQKHDIDFNVIKLNKKLLQYFCHNSLLDSGLVMPPYTLALLPQRLKNEIAATTEQFRVFITGNLMRCDHFASQVESGDLDLQLKDIEYACFPSYEALAATMCFDNGREPWQKQFFDRNKALQNSNLILLAPTGAGKTEFAYLWGAGRKNFFLLPMQAAVNSIFTRTEKLLSKAGADFQGHVSLLHGNAAIERRSHYRQQGEKIPEEQREGEIGRFVAMARHFAEPYIIATADQVAPAALRYPGYERTYAVLMDSALIIDEVQAYNPKAAAIITYLLTSVASLGGRVLLMTATLPPFIKKTISNRMSLSDQQVVNVLEQDITELAPVIDTVLHKIDFYLYETQQDHKETEVLNKLAQRLLDELKQDKKILAIFNTVKRAQAFYQCVRRLSDAELYQDNIILLHSRFTIDDKKDIEDTVVNKKMPNSPKRPAGGCLVISTQIVEASLNIDADILYTELCPIDSLLQRMGRVFRRFVHAGMADDLVKPNIIILLDRYKWGSGLLSSKRSVYDDDLIKVTLACLLMAANKIMLANDDVKQFCQNGFRSILDEPKQSKKGVKLPENVFILQTALQQTFTLDASQKDKLINQVYSLLAELESSYIRDYYDTLETLEYGYCADKLRDAQRIFREVSNVDVIPTARLADFIKKVEKWLKQDKKDFSSFQEQIINSSVISVPYNTGRKAFNDLTAWQKVMDLAEDQDKALRHRLERWLGNIQIVEADYGKELGLMLKENKNGTSREQVYE